MFELRSQRRSVSIYDGDELTVRVDDLTHGHFAEYDDQLSGAERERRLVDADVECLDALFADQADPVCPHGRACDVPGPALWDGQDRTA